MDNDHNLMMIVGVWTLRPAHRLRGPVPAGGRAPAEIPALSPARGGGRRRRQLGRHGGARRAPAGRAREAAAQPQGRASRPRCRRASASWRRSRSTAQLPLWRIHLVEDYDGGSALIVRIHHCIADGIALISVVLSLVDGGAAPPQRKPREAPTAPTDWIADALLKPFTDLTVKALDAAGDGAAAFAAPAGRPARRAGRLGRTGAPGLAGAQRRRRAGC